MSIMKSSKHMYVQFIDDTKGVTLGSASTLASGRPGNMTAADELGARAGKMALEKGIRRVVIDRGGFRFHGRVKAITDAAVAAGLSVTRETADDARTGAAPVEESK
jgi:large subunit ribosomal protein L18